MDGMKASGPAPVQRVSSGPTRIAKVRLHGAQATGSGPHAERPNVQVAAIGRRWLIDPPGSAAPRRGACDPGAATMAKPDHYFTRLAGISTISSTTTRSCSGADQVDRSLAHQERSPMNFTNMASTARPPTAPVRHTFHTAARARPAGSGFSRSTTMIATHRSAPCRLSTRPWIVRGGRSHAPLVGSPTTPRALAASHRHQRAQMHDRTPVELGATSVKRFWKYVLTSAFLVVHERLDRGQCRRRAVTMVVVRVQQDARAQGLAGMDAPGSGVRSIIRLGLSRVLLARRSLSRAPSAARRTGRLRLRPRGTAASIAARSSA